MTGPQTYVYKKAGDCEIKADVPYRQSVDMAGALARKGLTHELVTMRGHGHGFDGNMDDRDVQEAFAGALGFPQDHVK